MNIADETLTDYSFLSGYHYTKSKNYLKRRYRIRHWIPMFIGTPCTWAFLQAENSLLHWLNCFKIRWLSSNALQPSKPFLKKKALKFYSSFSILSEIKSNIIYLWRNITLNNHYFSGEIHWFRWYGCSCLVSAPQLLEKIEEKT